MYVYIYIYIFPLIDDFLYLYQSCYEWNGSLWISSDGDALLVKYALKFLDFTNKVCGWLFIELGIFQFPSSNICYASTIFS